MWLLPSAVSSSGIRCNPAGRNYAWYFRKTLQLTVSRNERAQCRALEWIGLYLLCGFLYKELIETNLLGIQQPNVVLK